MGAGVALESKQGYVIVFRPKVGAIVGSGVERTLWQMLSEAFGM
ncbi:MAG: hypothetical protein AVDCRST_MAG56-7951 [uncultured Cytophagales bacterium]|uniref:Uncharacterized protein n=1 Tax=uncultured Cytophagales bacterium TaxID=158755 RepID=A0A6J4LW47_9SPHI|nr:MAG: hypothetical protein AVDCRST_MAG56-7951 [uncultured Cytophagales bacterium]